MNICHIVSGDLFYGAEIQVLNILKGLLILKKKSKFKLIVIVLNKGELYSKLNELGLKVYFVDEKNNNLYFQFSQITNIIKTENIKIIHTHRYKENIIAAIIKCVNGNLLKLIKTQHGSFDLVQNVSSKRMYFYRYLDKFLTRYCYDDVISVSKDIYDQFKKFMPESKLSYIPNSIDFSRYNVSKSHNKKNYHLELNFAIIGRLVKIKNIGKFLNVMKYLDDKQIAFKGFIAGDGPEFSNLHKQVTDLELGNKIYFLGKVNNISEILNNIDILFITSLYEGVPTILLESMYFKNIVIAKPVGGIKEVIIHEFNGFFYHSNEDVLNIIKDILLNNKKIQDIKSNARKTIELNHSNLAQATEYFKKYYYHMELLK